MRPNSSPSRYPLFRTSFWKKTSALDKHLLQSSESLALTSDLEDLKKAYLLQVKLSLKPLMFAMRLFMEARLALRRKALKMFDSHNPHILWLMKSSPLLRRPFWCCRHTSSLPVSLERPMAQLLCFSISRKRISSTNSGRGPKKLAKQRNSQTKFGTSPLVYPRPSGKSPSPMSSPSGFQSHYNRNRKPKGNNGKGNGNSRQPFQHERSGLRNSKDQGNSACQGREAKRN